MSPLCSSRDIELTLQRPIMMYLKVAILSLVLKEIDKA